MAVLVATVLCLLAASNVFSAPTVQAPLVYRFDVASPFERMNFTATKIAMTPQSTASSQMAGLAIGNATKGIEIKFSCDASPARCAMAEAGFRLTFDTLTKIFAIQTSVVVQAVFRSFCIPLNEANTGSDGECSLKSALGQAGAAAYWLGRVERNSTSATDPLIAEQYLYPQALVKQFAKDVNVEWNEVDLLAEFNADANFWFPGDPPIQANQHDFSYVVMHEILHGFGFLSGWRSHFSQFLTPGSSSAEFLVPPPNLVQSGSSVVMEKWESLFVFDAFIIASDGSPTSKLADNIASYTEKGSISPFLTGFFKSPQYQSSKTMWNYATTDAPSLLFQLSSSTPAASSTPNNLVLSTVAKSFLPASSISHGSLASYTDSSEFLMRPVVESGTTLAKMIAMNGNGGGPLGKLTTNAMWKLGWDINPNYLPGGAQAVGTSSFADSVGGGGKFLFTDLNIRKPGESSSSGTPLDIPLMRIVLAVVVVLSFGYF